LSTWLGFDFGLKRVGVAVGQSITHSASALKVIEHTDSPEALWHQIAELIKTWAPTGLVVGLPLSADGNEQAMSHNARAFGDELHSRFKLEIHYVDERFSSRATDSAFRDARAAGHARRKDARKLDAHAAQRILEQFLVNR
jgi:putative holliday junction resolvase